MTYDPPCKVNGHLAQWGKLSSIDLGAAGAVLVEGLRRLKLMAKAILKLEEIGCSLARRGMVCASSTCFATHE